MRRVRLFCDWDRNSWELIQELKKQTPFLTPNNCYEGIQFVHDNSYDYAVIFNTTRERVITPHNKNIVLILEPPEIMKMMYGRTGLNGTFSSKTYSFAQDDYHEWAPGLGFTTVDYEPPAPLVSLKPRKACMMCSNKVFTDYHAKRRQVFSALLESDLDIDFYGRGMELVPGDERVKGEIPFGTKRDVYQNYAWCIDFENSPHGVVTDKFFDPLFSGTVPITNAMVAPSIAPDRSYELIDFGASTDSIVKRIDGILKTSALWKYDKPVSYMAKQFAMGQFNLTKWISDRIMEL